MHHGHTLNASLSILLWAFVKLVETCMEMEFQLEESLCCTYCPKGMYVSKNCSRTESRRYIGVTCTPCSSCEKNGQKTISECTTFSDTQCANIVSDYEPWNLPLLPLCVASVGMAVFIVAVVVGICSCYKIHKSDESSAAEPLNMKECV